MRGAFALVLPSRCTPLGFRRRLAPVELRLSRLAQLPRHVLMTGSRDRVCGTERDYGRSEQPEQDTSPPSCQALLFGGARIRAANESRNTNSIHTWLRGANGLAPPLNR